MSSDSETEFFDAEETTPQRGNIVDVSDSSSLMNQQTPIHQNTRIFKSPQKKSSNWHFKTNEKPLSKSLTSSMPSLCYEEGSTETTKPNAQSLLQKLDENFSKDKTIDMPPPPLPGILKPELLEREDQKRSSIETVSACSGSLLGYLGTEETKEPPSKGSTRRARHRDRRDAPLVDEDEAVTERVASPCGSISSSIDGVFPCKERSAPFRVIEHDATSVYSTTYPVSDKISKPVPESNTKECKTDEGSTTDDTSSISNTLEPLTPSSTEQDFIGLCPEPDVVASTKSNSLPHDSEPVEIVPKDEIVVAAVDLEITVNQNCSLTKLTLPTAPPRRKKMKKNQEDGASVRSVNLVTSRLDSQDFDTISHVLDIKSAMQGDCVVDTHDYESARGAGPIGSIIHSISHEEAKPIKPAEPSSYAAVATKSIDEEASEDVELSDQAILSSINIKNLDTGESIPLSEADAKIPSVLNPLSLHIMNLTNSLNGDEDVEDSEEESVAGESISKFSELGRPSVKVNARRLKNFLGKRVGSAVNKAKTLAQEVSHKGREERDVFEDVAPAQNTRQFVKIKTAHSHKGPIEFDNLMYAQELKGDHAGPVWCVKHSPCGRLLATAGQDHILRVWVLKQAFTYFLDIRTKMNADVKTSPTPSQESLVSQVSSHSSEDIGTLDPNDDGFAPYMPKPFCIYTGHTADVLDLSWSKHYFILSSSMDKTARLWHISRKECLCIFKHVDFVTAIAFHPRDNRYFISGSLDGKLRLWSIPDKQVVLWNEVAGRPKLITAANFCQNGSYIVVGTYNGRCIFYKTAELKYYTEIQVKSSRGKNSRGRKITGIEPFPDEDKLMITSNDSRIRIYDLNVLNVSCKYKGHSNVSSQIRAGFSHDGKYIVSGSENQCIYLWKTHHDYSKFSSARKDRNIYWEGVKAHSAVVTCAVFSPHPEHVFNFIEQQSSPKDQANKESPDSSTNKGYVLVSADFNGVIKVFLKKEKPKHSSLPASALA